jgi:flagellar biosynthetic protein FlhB
MADQEQEQNRNEQATPFKLKEARDRGVVAKSTEMNTVLVTLAFVALLFSGGPALFARQLRLDAALLSHAHLPGLSEEVAVAWLSGLLIETLWLLAPLFAVIMVAGVLASLLQTGPVFSFVPLKPDFDRINPASGLKRVFSMRLVFEAVKSVLKLALFGAAIYLLLDGLMPLVGGLVQTDPLAYPRIGLEVVVALLFKLALVMLAVALLDFGYVRWDFAKRMMMSRREMREEHKRREGDPKVRARIRELQREMRKRAKALRKVPEADVLITNPTHLAVALRYRTREMTAPQVLAKGAGELAGRMKLLARRHRVPIVENRALARALFLGAELDAPIPQAAFAEVARLLAWVYALREMRPERAPA